MLLSVMVGSLKKHFHSHTDASMHTHMLFLLKPDNNCHTFFFCPNDDKT